MAEVATATRVSIGIGTTNNLLTLFGTGSGNATLQIEGEGGADPYINFLANNAQHWSLGVDDSDSDKFKLSKHSALGTNDYFVVNTGGNVGIGTASPISGFKLDVQGGDFRVGDDENQGFEAGYSAGGGLVFLQGYNRGTNAFVDMIINNSLTVLAGGNSTFAGKVITTQVEGPSSLRCNSTAGNLFLDSTSDIILRTTSSNTPALTIDTSQNATFAGNITVGDGHFIGDDTFDNLLLQSSSGENLNLSSANDVIFYTGGTAPGALGTQRLRIFNTDGSATFGGNVNIEGNNVIFKNVSSSNRCAILTNETDTGTGIMRIQAGGISGAYGGGITLYANDHDGKAGDVVAGLSSGANGAKFRVNLNGVDTSTDVFSIDRSGNGNFIGNVTVGGTVVDAAGTGSIKSNGIIRTILTSGTADSTLINAISGVSNGFQLSNDASNNQEYIFHNGGVQSLKIDSSGNVGIGNSTTGTPALNADDLVIDKGASESGITLISTAAASIRFGDAANTSIGSIEYNHNSNYMRFSTNNAERMRIDSDGNTTFYKPTTIEGIVADSNFPIYKTKISAPFIGGWNTLAPETTIGGIQQSNVRTDGGSTSFSAGMEFYLESNTYGTGITGIRFKCGGVNGADSLEKMRIDSSGNVGINETIPTATLQVNGDIKIGSGGGSGSDSDNMSIQVNNSTYGDTANLGILVRNNGTLGTLAQIGFGYSESRCPVVIGSIITGSGAQTNGAFVIGTRTSTNGTLPPTERMRIASDGAVKIGTNSARQLTLQKTSGVTTDYYIVADNVIANKFLVSGTGQISAVSQSIAGLSDITLKENIKPLETGLNEILKLKPRRFDFINEDGKNIAGFVAQEVEEVLPDLVGDYPYNANETKKSLKMGDMIPTLVKAMQELKAEVEELKSKPCNCNNCNCNK